jgi:hypothetical protein
VIEHHHQQEADNEPQGEIDELAVHLAAFLEMAPLFGGLHLAALVVLGAARLDEGGVRLRRRDGLLFHGFGAVCGCFIGVLVRIGHKQSYHCEGRVDIGLD